MIAWFNEDPPVRIRFSAFWRGRFQGKKDLLPDLYRIRASIPLIQGKEARKMIKKLIDKVEEL